MSDDEKTSAGTSADRPMCHHRCGHQQHDRTLDCPVVVAELQRCWLRMEHAEPHYCGEDDECDV
jgi:hypothetical protein